jgi:hypothetical protein
VENEKYPRLKNKLYLIYESEFNDVEKIYEKLKTEKLFIYKYIINLLDRIIFYAQINP